MIIRFIVSRRHCSNAFARDCLVSYIANNNPPHIYWCMTQPICYARCRCRRHKKNWMRRRKQQFNTQANKIKEHERVIHVCVRVLNCARGRQLIDFLLLFWIHTRGRLKTIYYIWMEEKSKGAAHASSTLCV